MYNLHRGADMTLKEIRKSKNITQRQAAEYLGLPMRTYQNYEKPTANTASFKYLYMTDKLQQYGIVDEQHGVLTVAYIADVCREVFDEYQVQYAYLFGSYAKGKATETSDVDLFVSTQTSGLQYFGMVETLRERLGKKVDVLNQLQIKDNFDLTNEILKEGIKIYG